MSVQQQDPLLDVPDAGAYVGRNARFMREQVAKRAIEHVKVGGLIRFRQSVLDAYLADQTRRQVVLIRERTRKTPTSPTPRRRRRTPTSA